MALPCCHHNAILRSSYANEQYMEYVEEFGKLSDDGNVLERKVANGLIIINS